MLCAWIWGAIFCPYIFLLRMVLLLSTCYFMQIFEQFWYLWNLFWYFPLNNSVSDFFCAHFKVEEVRKVVDSELGFVADVPYRRSGAKVSMYGLLTKCEVKMAGYWPSSFFACLWTETKSRSKNLQKKERGQYPAILAKQTWSMKDLLYGFWWNFACRIQRVVPSGQDGSILPARVANHSARFGSSCPLAELAI